MTLPAVAHNWYNNTGTHVLEYQQQVPNVEDRQREHLQEDQQRYQHRHQEDIANPVELEGSRRSSFSRELLVASHHQRQQHQPRPLLRGNSQEPFISHLLTPEGNSNYTVREDHQDSSSRNRISSPTSVKSPLSVALSVRVQIPDMNGVSHNSPPRSPYAIPSTSPLFTISPKDAVSLVRSVQKDDDSRHCYLIHLTIRPLFSDDVIPGTCLRKLPRLINGIPLGPGFLSREQISEIKWRFIEGGHSILTFISSPLLRQEAEECKISLKERLLKQAQAVFGDLTVKVGVVLSRCLDFDDDLTLNDIAVNFGEGLHFRD